MQLQHIDLNQLKPATVNVRKMGGKTVDDLLPSIRELGVIQPLLVRQNNDGFEIVAGQRRYHALQSLAKEQDIDPVPCIIMSKNDDAKAIEASLAENLTRMPMDEIDRFKAFNALAKQGLSIEDIAARFAITEQMVKRSMAIADLISPILSLYRREKISAASLRILTMATKKQQRKWLELFKSDEHAAPQGRALKKWLLGGANIPTDNALFDLSKYNGNIVTDLFGEHQYFDDAEKFWPLQSQAIADLKAQYLKKGWDDVIVLDRGEYFPSYEYVDTTMENGGKVYIALAHDGEVTCHEGQLSRKTINAAARAKDKAENPKPKPELTKPLQNYLDLHKHSVIRTEILR